MSKSETISTQRTVYLCVSKGNLRKDEALDHITKGIYSGAIRLYRRLLKGKFVALELRRNDSLNLADSTLTRKEEIYDGAVDQTDIEELIGLPRTKRSGRPPEYPWNEQVIPELVAHYYNEGWPDRLGEVVNFVQKFCEDKYGRQPAKSTVEQYVRNLHHRMRKAKNQPGN